MKTHTMILCLVLAVTGNQATADDGVGWGESVEGLQTRITLVSSELEVGKPIHIRYEIRNSSDKDVSFDPQIASIFRVLKVKKSDDSPDDYIGGSVQTMSFPKTLAPKEVADLSREADITHYFMLAEPGEYKVQCAGANGKQFQNSLANLPASNTLTIKLALGKLPAEKQLAQRLLNAIDRKAWTVSLSKESCFLMSNNSDLKSQITIIEIWILKEQAENGGRAKSRDKIICLGHVPNGVAYLSACKVRLANHPDVVKKISNALGVKDSP